MTLLIDEHMIKENKHDNRKKLLQTDANELQNEEGKGNKNRQGMEIVKSDIRSALDKINRHKSTGPDAIVIEMLPVLEDFGIDKTTEEINGDNMENLSRSIVRVLLKESDNLYFYIVDKACR